MTDAAITSFVARAGAAADRSGVFLDFDGTLAAIVDVPDRAVPVDGAVEAVMAAGRRLGATGVLSGRPVDFLAPFFPDEVTLVGLYGLERRVAGELRVHPEARAWDTAIGEATATARQRFPAQLVEAKGRSLTVHYRGHDELRDEIEAWADATAAASGLHSRPARLSRELHPPVRVDKGSVLTELADGLEAVAYVGDDVGDLPAFAAVDALAAAGVVTLKLVVGDDLDTDVAAAADAVIAEPADTVAFVQSVVAAAS